jgi:hypothetical protein
MEHLRKLRIHPAADAGSQYYRHSFSHCVSIIMSLRGATRLGEAPSRNRKRRSNLKPTDKIATAYFVGLAMTVVLHPSASLRACPEPAEGTSFDF